MLQKARRSFGRFLIKSMFDAKNPGPLIKWGADLLGFDDNSVSKPYTQSIWIYRCLQQWMRVSQVPLLLKDAQGKDVTTGALAYVIGHPNADYSMTSMIEKTILSYGLNGEFFWLKEDGLKTTGQPLYYDFVSASCMTTQPSDFDRDGNQVSWTMSVGQGRTRKIPVQGVIYDALPNPYGKRGLAPVVAARASIDADFAARLHNKYQMDRHGRISGLVSMKEDTNEDQLRMLRKLWDEKYEGKENAGKTAFLSGGAAYQQLSMSAKDMDWMNGQDLSREEICAAFGISTIVAGGLKGATFSNYEQAMKAAWEEALIPLGNRISGKLTHDIVQPVARGQYLEFDFINTIKILQDDEQAKVDRYIALCEKGFMTPEQAATLVQIDLGKPHEAHKTIWINASLMPAEAALTEPVLEFATPPKQVLHAAAPLAPLEEIRSAMKELTTHKESEPETVLTDDEPPVADPLKPDGNDDDELPKWAPSSEIKKARIRANLRQIRGYEKKMASTMKAYFYEQRKSVLERLAESEMPVKSVETKKIDQAWITNLLNGADWSAKLAKRMRPLVLAVAEIGARQMLREVAGRFEPVALESYVKSQMNLLTEVNETTALALQAAANDLVAAIDAGGIPIDQLMDNLKTSFKGVYNNTEARRMNIARTETTRAMNGGRYEQMTAMGAPMKQWIAIMDGNVRSAHANLDGKTIPVEDEFELGLRFPGDPAASPGQTCNCRCSTIPIFDIRDAQL